MEPVGDIEKTPVRLEVLEEGRRRRRRLMFLFLGGAVGLTMLVVGGYGALEFMDSNQFCGQLCHEVMYPEYTTYEASPHGRVDCIDCHVGSGASYFVQSKASGVPQIFAIIFNTYEKPVPTPVANLRPARETCEACHWPERFSGDFVRVHVTYGEDEANTQSVDQRIFKVGGGQFEAASDIHWHIGADVWYLPLDRQRQDIPWVGVADGSGNLETYVNPAEIGSISPEALEGTKRLMDCIDCHNRATHIFYSPSDLIDRALVEGRIDQELPYIKREGVEALDPVNPSLEEALAKVRSIEDFYKESYPDVYAQKPEAIQQAIVELENVARLTTFSHMQVEWTTHIDNLTHQGCFRCHGTLVAVNGSHKGEVIDASCTLCHYPIG